MTGEMYSINQDGLDNDGNEWVIHAAIAKAVGGTLQPFDQYQGPYILVGGDVRIGSRPYQLAVQGLGIVRLWLGVDEDDMPCIYREDTDETVSYWPDDETTAIETVRGMWPDIASKEV